MPGISLAIYSCRSHTRCHRSSLGLGGRARGCAGVLEDKDPVDGGVVTRPIRADVAVWVSCLAELRPVTAGEFTHCNVGRSGFATDERSGKVEDEGEFRSRAACPSACRARSR